MMPGELQLTSADVVVQDMAQRAVTSYVRSLFLQPNRAVFDVSALPLAEYASAMGLLAAPKLRFLRRGGSISGAVGTNQPPAAAQHGGCGSDSDAEQDDSRQDDMAAEAAAAGAGADAGSAGVPLRKAALPNLAASSDEEDDFLVVRRHDVLGAAAEAAAQAAAGPTAKRKKKRLRIKPDAVAAANRVVFDDDGEARQPLELLAGDLDRCD